MTDQCAYGMWHSPVSAQDAARAVWLRQATLTPDGAVWWQEIRPEEDGRSHVLRAAADGQVTDLADQDGLGSGVWLPVPYGGAMVAAAERDGRMYLCAPGAKPRPLTRPPDGSSRDRVTGLVLGPDGREVWAVRASQRGRLAEWSLIAVPLDGSLAEHTLLKTARCVSAPRPSPDGSLLAWISWEPPQMPWDGAELLVGRVARAGVANERRLLGGPAEAVCHPQWASASSLYVVSDRSGWWNLYQIGLDGALRALCPWAEEFGWPQLEGAKQPYGSLADGRLALLHGTESWRLDLLDPADGELIPLDLPYDSWQPGIHATGSVITGVAGAHTCGPAIVAVNAADAQHQVLRYSVPCPQVAYVPDRAPATFTGRDGREVHAVVYPPRNPSHRAARAERVPYLLFVHDLPPTPVSRMLDMVKVFFTSRGLGVADVEVRGSGGYGRGYREQIYGRWGTSDVDDCAVVIRGLIEHWNADPARLVLRGAGAGGATALGLLASTGLCVAATVYAPVTDLELPGSAATRYLRQIAADATLLRSGSWLERIRRPVLMLHGLQDDVVSVAHTTHLRDALRSHHVPHACLTFGGEGHVFRRADTIARALEAELSFYGQVLGFDPPGTPRLAISDRISGMPSATGWPRIGLQTVTQAAAPEPARSLGGFGHARRPGHHWF